MRSAILVILVLLSPLPCRVQLHIPPFGRSALRSASLSPRCCAPVTAPRISLVRLCTCSTAKASARGSVLPLATCKFPRPLRRPHVVREKYPPVGKRPGEAKGDSAHRAD